MLAWFSFFFSGVTKDLEEVISKNNFIITLKHIRPRKRSRSLVETLFAVDFPGAEHKFLLLLDRKSQRGKISLKTFKIGV